MKRASVSVFLLRRASQLIARWMRTRHCSGFPPVAAEFFLQFAGREHVACRNGLSQHAALPGGGAHAETSAIHPAASRVTQNSSVVAAAGVIQPCHANCITPSPAPAHAVPPVARGDRRGAPVIRHWAVVVLGNGIVADGFGAGHQCGDAVDARQHRRAAAREAQRVEQEAELGLGFSSMPSSSNTALCISLRWIRIEPPPISLPLSTMS